MNWPTEFNLAQEHCNDVLLGCYSLPVEPLVILDIGANVGAFARWASLRWPAAKIHCYEPQPSNFALLQQTEKHYGLKNVVLHEAGVADKSGEFTLYENGFNCGEWSLMKFDANGDKKVQVQVMDAIDLPEADFIKLDTEGMELPIIKRLADAGKLDKVLGLVLEYHAATHVAPLCAILQSKGLMVASVEPVLDHRGLLKFLR